MGEMSDDANERALKEYSLYLGREHMRQEEEIEHGFLGADGETECTHPDPCTLDLNPNRVREMSWDSIERALLKY